MTFEANASRITEQLWLGNASAATAPLEELKAQGITHVLTPAMIAGFTHRLYAEDLVYLQYHIADLPGWPIIPLFPEASRFISDAIASGGCVLVHCANGVSRSASFVIAYLMEANGWSFADAKYHVRTHRPQISSKFEEQLRLWEGMRCSLDGDTPAHATARRQGVLSRHVKNRAAPVVKDKNDSGEC